MRELGAQEMDSGSDLSLRSAQLALLFFSK